MSKPVRMLISLVSDQRMQNVLPVFQAGMDFDQVMLVASEQQGRINPRYAAIATDLANAIGRKVEVTLYPQPMPPFDPEAARRMFNRLFDAMTSQTEIVVNYTGGTKPMAVGAYLAAEERGFPQLYVDTANERFLLHNPGQAIESVPFRLQGLSFVIYLEAHNRQINAQRTEEKQLRPEELTIARAIIQLGERGIYLVDRLHSRTFSEMGRIKMPRPLKKALEQAGFFSQGNLTEAGVNYFRHGRWLEAFTYQILRDAGVFDEVAGPTVFEAPSRADDQVRVLNEIDALVLRQGKLGLIECKTRLRRKEPASGQLSNAQDTLGKLKALRDLGAGLFGKGFIVTAQHGNRISPEVQERAREYRLTIIPKERLMELPQIIERTLSPRR